MSSVLYYNTLHLFKQGQYLWLVLVSFLLGFVSYILASLSFVDQNKIFVELYLFFIEMFSVLSLGYVVFKIYQQRSESGLISILYIQGKSYKYILSHILLSIFLLLFILHIFSYTFVLLLFYFNNFSITIDLFWVFIYSFLKLSLFVSVVHSIMYFMKYQIAISFSYAIYIFFYHIGFIREYLSKHYSGTISYTADNVLSVFPQLYSISYQNNYTHRLSTNLLTIVMLFLIYIFALHFILLIFYPRIRFK